MANNADKVTEGEIVSFPRTQKASELAAVRRSLRSMEFRQKTTC